MNYLMAKKEPRERIITGLDIGTTKVCAVIGELGYGSKVDIIGIGSSPSRGVRRGVVVNIPRTVEAIRQAIEAAEGMAKTKAHSVYVSVAGAHISGATNYVSIDLPGQNQEVRHSDIQSLIDAAGDITVSQNREILHVIPREYTVDDQDGIHEPIGIFGARLGLKAFLITGSSPPIQNVIKSVRQANIKTEDLVLQQLASAEAVLQADERELGTVLIDIGGGATDLAIYTKNHIRYIAVVPIGGEHFTNDLSIGLHTSIPDAEEIKRRFGCAMSTLLLENEKIEVPGIGGKQSQQVPRKFLCNILEPRAQELFELVDEEIGKSGYRKLLPGGAVITGGGSLLAGMSEIAGEKLEIPVRCGFPDQPGELGEMLANPIYSTSIGLLMYGAKRKAASSENRPTSKFDYRSISSKFRDWFFNT